MYINNKILEKIEKNRKNGSFKPIYDDKIRIKIAILRVGYNLSYSSIVEYLLQEDGIKISRSTVVDIANKTIKKLNKKLKNEKNPKTHFWYPFFIKSPMKTAFLDQNNEDTFDTYFDKPCKANNATKIKSRPNLDEIKNGPNLDEIENEPNLDETKSRPNLDEINDIDNKFHNEAFNKEEIIECEVIGRPDEEDIDELRKQIKKKVLKKRLTRSNEINKKRIKTGKLTTEELRELYQLTRVNHVETEKAINKAIEEEMKSYSYF